MIHLVNWLIVIPSDGMSACINELLGVDCLPYRRTSPGITIFYTTVIRVELTEYKIFGVKLGDLWQMVVYVSILEIFLFVEYLLKPSIRYSFSHSAHFAGQKS